MLVSEATWLAFAAFSGLRTACYVPQIVRIARDRNGASAISCPTWLLWTGAHASTGLYAAMNLNDVWLAVGSSIYALHSCDRPDGIQAPGSSADEGRAHQPYIPKRRELPRVGRTPEGSLT
jgi:hypothetical protein